MALSLFTGCVIVHFHNFPELVKRNLPSIFNLSTGYKRVCQFKLPAEIVHHIWLPPRLSAICFLRRQLCLVNVVLGKYHLGRKQNHTDSLCRKLFFMDCSISRKQEITDSLGGSQILRIVFAGSEN